MKEIIQHNPNIVVMDFHLAEEIKGSTVIQALNNRGFTGLSVGFSSDTDASDDFIAAGAKGAVNKDSGNPEGSVTAVAKLIAKK